MNELIVGINSYIQIKILIHIEIIFDLDFTETFFFLSKLKYTIIFQKRFCTSTNKYKYNFSCSLEPFSKNQIVNSVNVSTITTLATNQLVHQLMYLVLSNLLNHNLKVQSVCYLLTMWKQKYRRKNAKKQSNNFYFCK